MVSTLALLLVFAGPSAPGDELSARRWCHRLATDTNDFGFPWKAARKAEGAVLAVQGRYGPTVTTWLDLGHCRTVLGRYRSAAEAYRKAVRLAPGDVAAKSGLKDADAAAKFVEAADSRIHDDRILLARPIGGGIWAAGTGTLESDQGSTSVSRPRLRIYRFLGKAAKVVATAEPVEDPRFKDDPTPMSCTEIELQSAHFGFGPGEVVLSTKVAGVSWCPSTISLYQWNGRRLQSHGTFVSAMPTSLTDRDGDGRQEVDLLTLWQHEPHDHGRMFWFDVYAFDGKRLAMANRRFPGDYADLLRDFKDEREEDPEAFGLWERIGIIHCLQGRHRLARSDFRRASSLARDTIRRLEKQHADDEADGVGMALKRIQRRLVLLKGRRYDDRLLQSPSYY